MSKRGSYALRISGIGDGDHAFSFELDRQFFASLDQDQIDNGKVEVSVLLEKKPGVFSLHFHLKGQVEVVCDRCLEFFMAHVDTNESIFVKMGESAGEIEDDVIMIHRDDHEIEVGQLMYEFIVLALPLKRIHPDLENGKAGCDPKMLRKLEEYQGAEKDQDHIDPRWDALKRIKKK